MSSSLPSTYHPHEVIPKRVKIQLNHKRNTCTAHHEQWEIFRWWHYCTKWDSPTTAEELKPKPTIAPAPAVTFPTLHVVITEPCRQHAFITPRAPTLEPEEPPPICWKHCRLHYLGCEYMQTSRCLKRILQLQHSWETYQPGKIPPYQTLLSSQHLAEDVITVPLQS